MAAIVKMPKWGLTMTEGTITDWLLSEGSEVSEGDPLLTVETEKAVNDVEAPTGGTLVRIVADRGSVIPVSAPVAVILAPGETLTHEQIQDLIAAATPAASGGATATAAGTGAVRTARAAAVDATGRVNASPAARKRAQELGVDLATVEATGPGGRITSEDVERAAASAAADPTPRQERVRLADGREIAMLLAGPSGETPLVFVHGLGGSQSTWQVVLGLLADRHRVIAIDLPGHGQSDKSAPDQVSYSISSHADAVAEALSAVGVERAIVIGHSLGGAIALELATTRPSLTRALVLINSAALGETISGRLLELMGGAPGTDTARGLLELFFADQRMVLDRGVDEMAQFQTVPGAWAAQQATAQEAFGSGSQQPLSPEQLARISVPVLIIWGAQDRVMPLSHAQEAVSLLPDALLRVIPAAGHVPQVETAEIASQAIDRFARSLA